MLNSCASISKYGGDQLTDYMIRKNDQVKNDFVKNIKIVFEYGVSVAAGTDAGTPFNSFKSGHLNSWKLLFVKSK